MDTTTLTTWTVLTSVVIPERPSVTTVLREAVVTFCVVGVGVKFEDRPLVSVWVSVTVAGRPLVGVGDKVVVRWLAELVGCVLVDLLFVVDPPSYEVDVSVMKRAVGWALAGKGGNQALHV